MIGSAGLSVITVLISVVGSGFVSWRISKSKLKAEYRWERYHKAEEWCDDLIRLIRELQVIYEYKRGVMNKEWYGENMSIPGEDLDKYGEDLMKHIAQRPVVIFNIMDSKEREEGITDRVGNLSVQCGILSDSNLGNMENAPEHLDNSREEVYENCEMIIENVMDLRNNDLKEDFRDS